MNGSPPNRDASVGVPVVYVYVGVPVVYVYIEDVTPDSKTASRDPASADVSCAPRTAITTCRWREKAEEENSNLDEEVGAPQAQRKNQSQLSGV
jgi:hypothetical protein